MRVLHRRGEAACTAPCIAVWRGAVAGISSYGAVARIGTQWLECGEQNLNFRRFVDVAANECVATVQVFNEYSERSAI